MVPMLQCWDSNSEFFFLGETALTLFCPCCEYQKATLHYLSFQPLQICCFAFFQGTVSERALGNVNDGEKGRGERHLAPTNAVSQGIVCFSLRKKSFFPLLLAGFSEEHSFDVGSSTQLMSPNQDFSAMFSCPSALSCPCPIPFPLYTLTDVLIPMGFLVREQVNPHQQLYNNHSTSSCPSHIVTFKSAFLSSCTLLGDDNISVIMLVVMIPHLGRVA